MVVGIFAATLLRLSLFLIRPPSVAVARNPQILPYKYAIPVAGIIELRPFHYRSAPYPDHIHVHLCMHLHLGFIPLWVET